MTGNMILLALINTPKFKPFKTLLNDENDTVAHCWEMGITNPPSNKRTLPTHTLLGPLFGEELHF